MTATRHPAPEVGVPRLAAAVRTVRPAPDRQAPPAGGQPHPVRADTTGFGWAQETAARVGHPTIVTPSGGEQA
jgi:hypothetical protein